jgi:hypothetical protein
MATENYSFPEPKTRIWAFMNNTCERTVYWELASIHPFVSFLSHCNSLIDIEHFSLNYKCNFDDN